MAKTGVETVTRLRRSQAPARFGQLGPEVETEIRNCTLIPRTSSEDTDRADTVVVGLTLIAPPLTDLVATDRIRARGELYQIEGMPGDYRTKRGRAKAVMAALVKVTG